MDRLDLMARPPALVVRMPLRDRMTCLRQFGKAFVRLSEAGGLPAAVARLGPKGIAPEFAMVTSPQKAHDVSGASEGTPPRQGSGATSSGSGSTASPAGSGTRTRPFPSPMACAGPVLMKVRAR